MVDEPVRTRSLARPPFALALASHPAPTVAVTAFAVAMAAGADAPVRTTALVGAAVLGGKLWSAWSNDGIGAGGDAGVGRTDKPAGDGRLSASTVRNAAFAALAA